MLAVTSSFLPSLQPKEAKETPPQERFSLLRNSANLFNFGSKEVYQIREHEAQLVAVPIGKQKISVTAMILKAVLISTIFFPVMAYLAATLYHYYNKARIIQLRNEKSVLTSPVIQVERKIAPTVSSIKVQMAAPCSTSVKPPKPVNFVDLSLIPEGEHPKIETLTIDTLDSIDRRLKDFPNLCSIRVSSTLKAIDVSFLKECPNLTSLELSFCSKIQDFSFLRALSQLNTLDLTYCRGFTDLSLLQDHPLLTTLDISSCGVKDYSLLGCFTHLTSLTLAPMYEVNFSFLQSLSQLKKLNIDIMSIKGKKLNSDDVSFLSHLTRLTSFTIGPNITPELIPVINNYLKFKPTKTQDGSVYYLQDYKSPYKSRRK